MLAYRIESKKGLGLWREFLNSKDETILRLQNEIGERITPVWADKIDIRKDSNEWFCAFKTYDCIREKISLSELEEIVNIGLRVYIISVCENCVQIGEQQIAFTKDGIINKRDITELLIKKYQ